MIIIKIDKEELCLILGIKPRTLKGIENKNKLEERLQDKGYKYINKHKEGRKIYYEIELINNSKELYSNMCKYVYKTTKQDEFKDYFLRRTLNASTQNAVTTKELAIKTNVGSTTICKWDKILLNCDIIGKDDYFYFCIERNGDTIIYRECQRIEYKEYYKNKAKTLLYKDLQLKLINGSITLDEFTLAIDGIASTKALIDNKYYYRIKKYKLHNENQLFIDTLNLIKAIYGNKELKIEYELIE